ncbi:alpha amylase C-terminal domain-containing protein [Microbulbifer aggregans]|uniref:alpha amylase C-terminal domain-containing protein n=1 Tax=Microbulbifer aggregans TaxID=1769779 RepID=UPI001CFD61CC|nr:alpha amylase C-terminal domain-containing protein [Microbulbifer aggregans]
MKNYLSCSRRGLQALTCLIFLLSSIHARAGTAFVHLFEWSWNDIASECESFLGPKGFDAVQISPPQEHISLDTWWARYQPVTYTNLNSRSGSEAELASMIQRCHAAGVKVYADMVINHTAAWNQGGTGWGGTPWSVTNHPEFSPQDYHTNCTINNYSDANNVWNCRLSGLPDLDTGSTYVQDTLAAYFDRLTGLGVDGFRIDAVKHMAPGDLQAILAKAGNPWVFSEVIGAAGEADAIQPYNYTYLGHVTEFKYGNDVASNFNGQIKNLASIGESWGLLPSGKAVHFIDNHDRERGHGGGGNLTYKDGATYNLANVFMLAHPYGYPKVMSGYAFTDTDIGPPAAGPAACTNSAWVCQHRWGNIANMVGFRNYVDGTAVANWWDNGNNQIAFARGNKGYVVVNNENDTLNQTLYTGLPAGDYCNVLAGADACSGEVISVDTSGYATFNLTAKSAAAIHGGAIATPCIDCVAQNFPQLYFRGTANDWLATPMALVADNSWQLEVTFDGQADQRFKLDINADWTENYGDDGADGVLDQAGADIYTAVVGNYLVEVNDQNLTYTLTLVGNEPQPPKASVTPLAITVAVNEAFTLDASSSSDSDGNIVSYSWSSGGSEATTQLNFSSAGSYTETVTVTDNDGLTDSISASITVTDPDDGFTKNFSSLNFRGTPNAWGTQAMTLVADNTWQVAVVFDGSADQRFKFDISGDWSVNYGDTNGDGILEQGGGDIYSGISGTFLVQVNDQSLEYQISCIDCTDYQSSFSQLYFRGTPNNWGSTAMTLVADHIWELEVDFDGQSEQRFKFDVNADWAENYGDSNSDGVLEQEGSDIYTTASGRFRVRVNDQSMTYSLIAL